MTEQITITTDTSKATAAFGVLITGTKRETRQLVDRIAGDMRDALKRNVPRKTGNMQKAVNVFKMASGPTGAIRSFEPGDTYRVGVGFKRLGEFSGMFTKQPLKYVMAQNYGDTTVAEMHIPGEDPKKPGFYQSGNYGFWIKKRTIPALGFIEESRRETVAQLDIETAKFVRAMLIR